MSIVMDSDASPSSSLKNQNLLDTQSGSSVDDRISSLPNHIIHHILSFLSAAEVVRVSVLSTRWNYLWKTIPNLDFLKSDFRKYINRVTTFEKIVDRVLSLHDASNLYRFSLTCGESDCEFCFESWISTLARHNLGELCLRITTRYFNFKFPCCLSHFHSLKVLEVRMRCTIPVSPSICFSSLRVLFLHCVTFSSSQLTQEISLTFPILELLTIWRCNWLETKTVNVNAPSLTKLWLRDGRGPPDISQTKIKVDAKNLTYLSVEGYLYDEYSLSNLPSIDTASLDIHHGSPTQRLPNIATKIYGVRDLKVSTTCIETLLDAGDSADLQMFPNLVNLNVSCKGYGFSPKHLVKLLCRMPKIESLVINLISDIHDDEKDTDSQDGWMHEAVPQWFLSKLKSVHVITFTESEKELCLITYLLARTLEKMIIDFSTGFWEDSEKQNRIFKRVQSLQRGSPVTEVSVRSTHLQSRLARSQFFPIENFKDD